LYNVNFVSGNTLVPVSLVNIHAKAEDGNAMSYTRRLGGSQSLKTILDGADYNSKNLIFIGDFNDYLVGTTSYTCGCTDSPYKNFIEDEANYNCITKDIMDASVTWTTFPIIEHIIISDELIGNYISNSAVQEVTVSQNISNFFNTTSDHFPVSATFQFSVLENPEFSSMQESSWAIYPNPVKSELKFEATGLSFNSAIEIYDLTGRQMRHEKIDENTLSVATLPSGIYILKMDNRFGRFVKK